MTEETHQPVELSARIVGCSCGFTPKPQARSSMLFVAFDRHRSSLGLPPVTNHANMRIMWGEHTGKTAAEAYPGLFGRGK